MKSVVICRAVEYSRASMVWLSATRPWVDLQVYAVLPRWAKRSVAWVDVHSKKWPPTLSATCTHLQEVCHWPTCICAHCFSWPTCICAHCFSWIQ